MALTLKVGTTYRTRNGYKRRIIAQINNKTFPFISILTDHGHDSVSDIESHKPDGSTYISAPDRNDLVAEITPYEDWKIDDPVWVRGSEYEAWKPRHFAGVISNGKPQTWEDGQTSHTTSNKVTWTHITNIDPNK